MREDKTESFVEFSRRETVLSERQCSLFGNTSLWKKTRKSSLGEKEFSLREAVLFERQCSLFDNTSLWKKTRKSLSSNSLGEKQFSLSDSVLFSRRQVSGRRHERVSLRVLSERKSSLWEKQFSWREYKSLREHKHQNSLWERTLLCLRERVLFGRM